MLRFGGNKAKAKGVSIYRQGQFSRLFKYNLVKSYTFIPIELTLADSSSLKIGHPKRKINLPSIDFQVIFRGYVSFREGIHVM